MPCYSGTLAVGDTEEWEVSTLVLCIDGDVMVLEHWTGKGLEIYVRQMCQGHGGRVIPAAAAAAASK
jgi:hypothetical protein